MSDNTAAEGSTPEQCTPAWAQKVGVFDLQTGAIVPTDLAQAIDRMIITETAGRYAIAYDERRLDVIEAIMTEGVTFSYRVGEGPVTSYTGRSAVIEWLGEVMESQTDQRRHLVSPTLVEDLTATSARVVGYSGIFAVDRAAHLVTTNVYVFEFERQGDRWLISSVLDALDRPF